MQECIVDDEVDMDEAAQVCLLNTLQPGGSLVAAGKSEIHAYQQDSSISARGAGKRAVRFIRTRGPNVVSWGAT